MKKNYYEACEKFIEERERFFTELQTIPFIRVVPSQANYFLCEVVDKFTSAELTQIMLERFNILIKDCGTKSAFGSRNYVRIAVRGKEDNQKLVASLKAL